MWVLLLLVLLHHTASKVMQFVWVLLLLVLLHHTASKVMQFVWVLLLLVLLHHTVSKISRCRTTQCMHRITESNYNQCKIFNLRIYKCQTCARVGIRYRGNFVSDVCYNCVYAANWVNFPFFIFIIYTFT